MSNSFNHWEQLADALQKGCEQCVDITAEQAVSHIREKIEANGQVASGEMRDSVYKISQRGSTYQSSEHALDELPTPDSATEADVAVAAKHGIFQDKGTVYLAPRPFFDQGLDNTRGEFDKNLEYYVVGALEDAAK